MRTYSPTLPGTQLRRTAAGRNDERNRLVSLGPEADQSTGCFKKRGSAALDSASECKRSHWMASRRLTAFASKCARTANQPKHARKHEAYLPRVLQARHGSANSTESLLFFFQFEILAEFQCFIE